MRVTTAYHWTIHGSLSRLGISPSALPGEVCKWRCPCRQLMHMQWHIVYMFAIRSDGSRDASISTPQGGIQPPSCLSKQQRSICNGSLAPVYPSLLSTSENVYSWTPLGKHVDHQQQHPATVHQPYNHMDAHTPNLVLECCCNTACPTCLGLPLFLHKLANLSQASTSSCMGTTRLRTLNKLCHTCSREASHTHTHTYTTCHIQGNAILISQKHSSQSPQVTLLLSLVFLSQVVWSYQRPTAGCGPCSLAVARVQFADGSNGATAATSGDSSHISHVCGAVQTHTQRATHAAWCLPVASVHVQHVYSCDNPTQRHLQLRRDPQCCRASACTAAAVLLLPCAGFALYLNISLHAAESSPPQLPHKTHPVFTAPWVGGGPEAKHNHKGITDML